MILCAPSTSRSREQSTKRRSHSESMRKVRLFSSENNVIVWLSNMTDIFFEKLTRCAKVCGLFILIMLSECWLVEQENSDHMEITTTETQKMCQRYFCPAEYITRIKPKHKHNPKRKTKGLGLVLGLGFVLVMYSAGQKYRWHIAWSRSLLVSLPSIWLAVYLVEPRDCYKLSTLYFLPLVIIVFFM